MNQADTRAQPLTQLKWSLQALALPYQTQRNLFPSFAVTAEELALDFDHWYATAKGQELFTAEQGAALESVACLLSAMTDERDPTLWTDSALANLPRWQEVREHANDALRAFQCSLEMPPPDRAIFVQ